MTDRAKKISELSTTSSVANTDKIVVLKDAANTSAASTRAMTVNAFAQSIGPIVRKDIANSIVTSNTVTVSSNGTTAVPFVTLIGNDAGFLNFHANDLTSGDIVAGQLVFVANNTNANLSVSPSYVSIGSNPILFDNEATVNVAANTITLYLRRNSSATSQVIVKYTSTTF